MNVPSAIITNQTSEVSPPKVSSFVASEGLELLVLMAELEVAAALAGRLESAGSVV
jgi:hypothetical protein